MSPSTTFTDNMRLPVHRWYRYSAGYSAQWAENVVQYWGHPSTVLDPFGGSGTTCLAAQSQGVRSLAVEAHPVAFRVARAKLRWNSDHEVFSRACDQVVREARSTQRVELPDAPLVQKCFPDNASLSRLIALRNAVLGLDQGKEESELVWLAFLSAIRPSSPAGTAQWQYVLPNHTKVRVLDPFDAFAAASRAIAEDMLVRKGYLGESPAAARVLLGDARDLDDVGDGWAEAVITSPPYANNYDYGDAFRLEQAVLGEVTSWADLHPIREGLLRSTTQGMRSTPTEDFLDDPLLATIRDPLGLAYRQLGELRKERAGHKAYDAMILGYFLDNARVLHALRRTTVSGARICYVVGDSAPYGVHVPVERWLGELALSAGFNSWRFDKVRDRNMKWKNRKHDHPLHEGHLWIDG